MSLKTFDHAFYSKKVKKMSWEQLLFVIKDCQSVLKAWPEILGKWFLLFTQGISLVPKQCEED